MHENRYHKFLRVSIVVFACLLVFDSGVLSPVTRELSDGALQYLANSSGATGVFVGVAPNELNQLTAELTAREQELNEREAALAKEEGRTIDARNFNTSTDAKPDYSTYILSIILFILTVLIVLNYAMDWARLKRMQNA